MLNKFQVNKTSNTYADTLEAYGLAHLLKDIGERQNNRGKVNIEDKGFCYEIQLSKPITAEEVKTLRYFPLFSYIKKDEKNGLPKNFGERAFIDYPAQRALRKERAAAFEALAKQKLDSETYKKKKRTIEEKYSQEGSGRILSEYDVVAQLISNPYAAYVKLFGNLFNNKEHFGSLVSTLLNNYLPDDEHIETNFIKDLKEKQIIIDEKSTMLQLLNPNQGKGLNKAKATGMSVSNLKGSWISETLKVTAALRYGMVCQSVKVGSSYDLKVYVPAFTKMEIGEKVSVMSAFKKNAKSSTAIKLDILNLLSIIELFLRKREQSKRGKVKEHLQGLHAVYQKDLGQNKAVVNISFLETPEFIDVENKEDWLEILEAQKKLIRGIDEKKSGTNIGLLAYRNFLTGSDVNAYFKFLLWYSTFLMHEITNSKQSFLTTNKIEILNKTFQLMSNVTLKEIIENEGFQSVAAAIRKSTVSLQYTPKESRKFSVQYGVAQKLQTKSNSKEDLITFIGDFIGKYNSDNAREYEKTKSTRKNVRNDDLAKFFELADLVDSKMLGAMLSAYGFALNKKDKADNGDETNENE